MPTRVALALTCCLLAASPLAAHPLHPQPSLGRICTSLVALAGAGLAVGLLRRPRPSDGDGSHGDAMGGGNGRP